MPLYEFHCRGCNRATEKNIPPHEFEVQFCENCGDQLDIVPSRSLVGKGGGIASGNADESGSTGPGLMTAGTKEASPTPSPGSTPL
jgi:putative FmdB family regulatory protein